MAESNNHSGRRREADIPRSGYVLAISGVLGLVTFTLVYLSTLSFAGGF